LFQAPLRPVKQIGWTCAYRSVPPHARRTGGTAKGADRRRRGGGVVDRAKVREWVRGRAIEIKDRGRVLVAVIQQYQATAGAYKPERPCEIATRLTRQAGAEHARPVPWRYPPICTLSKSASQIR
jgi:hypothetical protein